MKAYSNEKYDKLIKTFVEAAPFRPDIAIVLGSGLGDFADSLEKIFTIATSELPEYPQSTVAGHKGFMHFCKYMGKKILLFQGRVHFYEGYKIEEVLLPVFLAKQLDVASIIFTNAAGGINSDFSPGDIMLVNAFYPWFIKKELSPFLGVGNFEARKRFYDFPTKKISAKIKKAALENKIEIREGSYWYTTGPNYETPAEIRMMKKFGADAVGMSTAHEAIFANFLGMDVGAISLITNLAAGISPVKLSHQEVIEAGLYAKPKFEKLLKSTIALL